MAGSACRWAARSRAVRGASCPTCVRLSLNTKHFHLLLPFNDFFFFFFCYCKKMIVSLFSHNSHFSFYQFLPLNASPQSCPLGIPLCTVSPLVPSVTALGLSAQLLFYWGTNSLFRSYLDIQKDTAFVTRVSSPRSQGGDVTRLWR